VERIILIVEGGPDDLIFTLGVLTLDTKFLADPAISDKLAATLASVLIGSDFLSLVVG
jgi:hypothetical protein